MSVELLTSVQLWLKVDLASYRPLGGVGGGGLGGGGHFGFGGVGWGRGRTTLWISVNIKS